MSNVPRRAATWAASLASADVGWALERLLRDIEIEHGRLAIDVARCRERRQLVLAHDLAQIQDRMAELLKAGRTWRRRALPDAPTS